MSSQDLLEHERLWAQFEQLWDEFYGERERRQREHEKADRQQAAERRAEEERLAQLNAPSPEYVALMRKRLEEMRERLRHRLRRLDEFDTRIVPDWFNRFYFLAGLEEVQAWLEQKWFEENHE